jgi:tellurite methyltransferase
MSDGGYDIGYKECSCFWGTKAGSLILKLDSYISNYNDKLVLDLGCGEANNSIYLADKGCVVEAYDISRYAILNASKKCHNYKNIRLQQSDILKLAYPKNTYDIIISYGLFHCLGSINNIETVVKSCINSLKENGYFVICSFNNRRHDLSAHEGFNPLLLSHVDYLNLFRSYTIIFESDEDLFETHPHNNIPHMHSMTRIIIKK